MDIDDILASAAGGPSAGHRTPEARDLQQLTRAWVNEKGAPELLPWPGALMERVLDRIRGQIELVEEQTGNMDPKINFRLIIVQTELERFKFLVRSLLRARIAKIDKFALHYLNTPEQNARLSSSEQQYAASHQMLLHGHYQSSFLSQFHVSLQRLDDTAGGIAMTEQPDVDRAVFVRALVDSGDPVSVEGTDIDFEMRKGSIYVVRWSAVRDKVHASEAELI